MTVKLLTEHHLEFLSLKGGCRGLTESTHVKMPHCWKSHALAHFFFHTLFLVVYNDYHIDPDIFILAQSEDPDQQLLRTHNVFSLIVTH